MTIQKGDQYAIPIKIKMDDTVITTDNCDDVRIQVGTELAEYSSGGITYGTADQTWRFMLTERMSFKSPQSLPVQIGVKVGTDFIYSPTKYIDVSLSIIGEYWT